jgi:hypothetical protein
LRRFFTPQALSHCGVKLVTACAVARTKKIMPKLTHTQLITLSTAAAQKDGAAPVPAKMNKIAASKLGSALVAQKLVRESRSKPGMPVWWKDEDGRSVSLIITRAGRAAIGIEDETNISKPEIAGDSTPVRSHAEHSQKKQRTGSRRSSPAAIEPEILRQSAVGRIGSKKALVISMLSQGEGATVEALAAATGWLHHTTRAVLSGLRKRGYRIERRRMEGATTSAYRIHADMTKAA